eukprot:354906-Chlamydomonas_euryale.AAC.7
MHVQGHSRQACQSNLAATRSRVARRFARTFRSAAVMLPRADGAADLRSGSRILASPIAPTQRDAPMPPRKQEQDLDRPYRLGGCLQRRS